MITVAILINGQPIFTRSAVNVKTIDKSRGGLELCLYELDDGSSLEHIRQDGAVALSIEMLKTIKEAKLR